MESLDPEDELLRQRSSQPRTSSGRMSGRTVQVPTPCAPSPPARFSIGNHHHPSRDANPIHAIRASPIGHHQHCAFRHHAPKPPQVIRGRVTGQERLGRPPERWLRPWLAALRSSSGASQGPSLAPWFLPRTAAACGTLPEADCCSDEVNTRLSTELHEQLFEVLPQVRNWQPPQKLTQEAQQVLCPAIRGKLLLIHHCCNLPCLAPQLQHQFWPEKVPLVLRGLRMTEFDPPGVVRPPSDLAIPKWDDWLILVSTH